MIEDFLNKIINGDCLQIIPTLPDKSIDLVLTSPPYNVDLEGYDSYKDLKKHKEYIKWLESIFKALYSKMKKGGRICFNVGDGCNGKVHTHVDIINFMCKLKYLHMSTIIWDKENTSLRTAWGSFKSPVNPSFPTPYEYLLIFAKESFGLQDKGETDLTKEEFVKWSMALWRFPRQDYKRSTGLIRSGTHPAPFPESLPMRLIKMLSWKEAVILDPFMGSGTTARACKRLGRSYIGIDISKKYCRVAENSLNRIRVVSYSLFED
jgi:site-specific DNA-methyltransferase (adenine-specific)